jgi:hypothetical protein
MNEIRSPDDVDAQREPHQHLPHVLAANVDTRSHGKKTSNV